MQGPLRCKNELPPPFNAKLLLITACCLTAAGGIFYYFSQPAPLSEARKNQKIISHHTSSIANHEAAITQEAAINHEKIVSLQAPAEISTPTSVDDIRTITGTPAEAAVVRQWNLSRGDYLEEDLDDYLSYDWDTLRKLANTGDIKAMMALAKRSITRPFPPQGGGATYRELIHKAAVYGSSRALSIIAIKTPDELSGSDGRAHLLESLAWNNTAALRGDIYPLGSALQDLADNKSTLSRNEIAEIHARSQEIYNELSRQRETLGLGPFDNSVPKEVAQYQENLKRYFKDGFKLFEVN